MSRKTRPEAFEEQHPEAAAALEIWFFEEKPALTLAQALARLGKDFGLDSSEASLSRFWQRASKRRLLERITSGATRANAVVEQFDRNPAETYRAVISLVGQLALEQATQEGPQLSTKELTELVWLMLAGKKEERQTDELRLKRDKFELEFCEKLLSETLRRQADEIANSNLSNADKIAAMRKAAFADVDALQATGEVQIPK